MLNVKVLTPRQVDKRKRIPSATRELVTDHGYDGMVMSSFLALLVPKSTGTAQASLLQLLNQVTH